MKKSFLVFVLVCLAASCAKKEEKTQAPPPETAAWLEEALDLEKAVVRTPPSIVSSAAELDVEFRDPVVPDHLRGTILDKNPFTFEPPIEGRATWFSQRVLRFTPDKRLPAGRAIEGTLLGKVAFGEQKRVNDLKFSFKVAEQEVISLSGDFVPIPEQREGVKYLGVLEFAQPVDVEEIQKAFSFKGARGKVEFRIAAADAPENVQITSEVMTRTQAGEVFTVSLPAKYSAAGDKWERSVFLPGLSEFRVIAHSDMTAPGAREVTYGFRFGDPIATGADLTGYTTIEPEVPYTVRVDGKYLLLQGDFVPGRTYAITIAEGFPSAYGGRKAKEYKAVFSPSNIKPEIQWLSEGIYLPSDNAYRLQFKSVNVAKVTVRVTEIYQQNIGFFLQSNTLVGRIDTGARRWGGRFEYNDLYRVGEQIFEKDFDITMERNAWTKSELDLGPVFKGKSNSLFAVTMEFDVEDLVGRCVNDRESVQEGDLYYEPSNFYDDPCKPGYYYSRGAVSKLLIATDVALTVKSADDGLHVFATNILAARPAGSIPLDLYSYQNKLLESQSTSGDGYAHFSQKGAYILGTHPSGVVVIAQNQPSWLLNNFDVGGALVGKKGIDAFTYADRGVHRPGDTVHLSAIVRFERALPPEKQPVLLKVKDPKGQVVYEAKAPCGTNGHVYFPIATEPSDPTGDWLAELAIGDETFYHGFKIETVKPNRLKVQVEVPEKIKAPEKVLGGTVTCKYLFGAPGAGLRTDVMLDLSGTRFSPDGYPEYVFSTPLKRFTTQNFTVLQGAKLDAEGKLGINYSLPDFSNAPELVRGVLRTTVYESGGSFVTESRVTTIYPFTAFVGVKNPFDYGGARAGTKYPVPIAVVDGDGKPVSGHVLKVAVYVNPKRWWWDYDEQDRRDFRNMPETYRVGEYTYVSTGTPLVHDLTVEDDGRHLIEVVDVTSGHEAGFFFYASPWGESAPDEEKERNYLSVTSNKNVYYVGDEVSLGFDTPSEGVALFTLEQGSRVIHHEWKPVQAKRTVMQFKVTEDMVPNCYASLSLIQPHNQNTNDVPMRLYGVKTLYVEDRATHMPLEINAPESLRPKEKFTLEIVSRSPEKGTATVAIVDDGLLDLTHFKTPSPWDHFFQKIGLGVTTIDNFDQIMGVLFPDIDKHFTIGGGEFEAAREKRVDEGRAMRFKPVVLFTQPLDIGPGQTKRLTYTMPNYVGSVRVMVVGASGRRYGSAEKTIPVKQEIMVLPTVPRVARPGDTFALPVSVFVTDSTVRDVSVSLAVSGNLSVEGPASASVSFAKPGEKDTEFTVTVGNAVGADSTTVRARSGSFAADNTVNLPITSSNPFYTETTDTTVSKGTPVTLVLEKFGLDGTSAARIALSRMPDIQIDKRFTDLIRYPYGCIEQIVSAAFPQLFLPYLSDLAPYQKAMVTDNVNAAVKSLGRYRLKSGFTFWPVGTEYERPYSDWGSTYAGHFLVEARALGYHVPEDLYKHWLGDARRHAKTVNKNNHRYQTYRLFVLALAGDPDTGAMNLVRENYLGSLDPLSRRLLAAAYYVSGMENVSREILSAAPVEIAPYREPGGTYGSALRDTGLMAYLAMKTNDMDMAARLLKSVAGSFESSGWFSTQELATTLLAIGAYYKGTTFPGGAVALRLKVGDGAWQEMLLSGFQKIVPLDDAWGKPVVIDNKSDNPLFVTLFEEGVPIDNRIKTEQRGIELTRGYFSDDGHVVDVADRAQGEPFWVVYKVRSALTTAIDELALSSVFPAGWEIFNPRVTGDEPPEWVRNLSLAWGEYMDVRDDRVNWFFDLAPNQVATFAVRINPTFKGDYVMPPVVCEPMYTPEYYARIAGARVKVR
jgi:uncharacterized protein YfaS (alpha-2-macroglobulin family)